MSWVDRLKDIEFTITCGDGKVFKPLWKSGEKSKDFNTTKYDFINVEGSFIDRKKSQSNTYPLIFWFQGEDNIEQAEAFEESANDSRYWTVEHPFYGTIKGQPNNLKRSDTAYNVTEVLVDFWESIIDDLPKSSTSARDAISSKVDSINILGLNSMTSKSNPTSKAISLLANNLLLTKSKFKPNTDSFNNYQGIITKASTNVTLIVSDTLTSFTDLQDVINAPALFATPVIQRVQSFVSVYEVIKLSIPSVFSKYNFESQSASMLAGACLAAVNPVESDYITRDQVNDVNVLITTAYNDYLSFLDEISVEVYNVEETYSPDVAIQSALNELVNFTSKALFDISFDAKQERLVELNSDTNLIVLTHKYFGLDADDKNILAFKETNNIKNDELFKIPKGRVIKYYS
jgi:hypothetical protein